MEQSNQHKEHTSQGVIEGQTVLVISSAGYSQRYIWDVYQEFGLKIILVDFNILCYGSSKASHFLQYDFQDHRNDEQHAVNIVTMLQEKRLKIDGCITFWDDCGPLAAIICERLGLHGSGKEAAKVAKTKSSSHNILRRKMEECADTYQYTSKCYPINSLSDIDNAISYVGVPAVLKPEHGSRSIGVKQINESEECKDMYLKLKLLLSKGHPQTNLGYGDRFMIMEFLYGTKHDIDIVIFKGEMVIALVSDCGPKRQGHFVETTTTMPTCLKPKQEEQLKVAAFHCCCGIGLVHGVFSVEMKMTLGGPKLIEINGRMSGYMSRDWILHCYEVDLLLISFMVCLGICPEGVKPTAKCQLMGVMCFPSEHKEQFEKQETLKLLDDMSQRGIIRYNQLALSMDDCCGDTGDEVPFCNIAAVNSSITKAKQNLIEVSDSLGIITDNYDLTYLLSEFEEH